MEKYVQFDKINIRIAINDNIGNVRKAIRRFNVVCSQKKRCKNKLIN